MNRSERVFDGLKINEPKWSETFQKLLDETIEEIKTEYPLSIKEVEKKELGFTTNALIILAINIYRRKVVENMKDKGIELTIKNNFELM